MNLATPNKIIVLIKSLTEILELGFQDGNKQYDENKPYSHLHAILIHRGYFSAA